MEKKISFLDEHRKSPDRTDLPGEMFAHVAASTWALAHEHQFHGGFGLFDALQYSIGAGQTPGQRENALRFIEEWRGTPEFSHFTQAIARLQAGADSMRRWIEEEDQRKKGHFRLQAVTRENSQDLEAVPPPNTTRAQRKSPKRVRLVAEKTPPTNNSSSATKAR